MTILGSDFEKTMVFVPITVEIKLFEKLYTLGRVPKSKSISKRNIK